MNPGKLYAELVVKVKPESWTENEWGVVLACFNVGTMLAVTVVLSLLF